jgi:hypothetical protein
MRQISNGIIGEINVYRAEMQSKPSGEVYENACYINLVEEMAYLICEKPGLFEDDEQIIDSLDKLSQQNCFLTELMDWANSVDSFDVSNVEKTCDTLKDFCDAWFEKA